MNKEFNCPVEATISLIGGKYKSVILFHLMGKRSATVNFIKRYRKPPIKCSHSNFGNWKKMDLSKEPSIRLSRPKQSTT